MRFLVHHMLRDSASARPDHPAIVGNDQCVDYQTMTARVASLANGLREAGVRRGDRVAVFLRPGLSLPIAIFAVAQAGGVFVPIHHGFFAEQAGHILRDCGATALITDSTRWDLVDEVLATIPQLQFAVIDGTAKRSGRFPTLALDQLVAASAKDIEPRCIEKDLAAILYTSGSTGKPKGVMLSHANLLSGTEIVADYLAIGEHDRILAALPFSFDAGLNQLMTAVLKAATTVMIEFRFGRDIVGKLAAEQITALAGVPSLWSLLAQPSAGLAKQSLPHLRYITNTGGAIPQNVLAQLRQLLPQTDIVLMYGLTEAFRSTYLPPAELDRRPTSMGKAIPNTEIVVVDEHGRPCEPGQVGELVHHGPTVSLGYWGHPELTDRILRPHPFPAAGQHVKDRVCYSGDLVKTDEDGFLYFVGRRDNQIKSSGFRISPNDVEAMICKVASVRQAAVIGVPDAILGQHLVAFAIAEENAGVLSANDILARCAGVMPRHMVPKRIEFVDVLPMTSSGKVDYPALRQRVSENHSQNT
ncbi:Long-chain-fatty-acid--CoA ligase [Stieleria neptunia]|uniref:Long-chain-fatty-acid--CoA ligase n=1 Tax=Stieleria neptunia TaxID=2527979 RepID=A0A518HT38_9BACT|nr:AMP-binding protein [Stieleria neptunia]QDV44015.1 Long-chain-fatty-acid--CoA ligase [Stieleria neptunia]